MDSKNHPSERGQALILIVLALVVLLGFTALAVDGSVIYSDRRYAQNAADAASLAGGGEAAINLENEGILAGEWNNCSNSVITDTVNLAEAASIGRALSNDFTIDDDISDNHGVQVVCGEETTPIPGNPAPFIDVIVDITMDSQPTFAQFVYQGELRNTVKAVTRVFPRHTFGYGEAIIALNDDPCSGQSNGLTFHSGEATIDGGSAFSNGCLRGDGTPTIVQADSPINYFDDLGAMGGTFTPPPNKLPAGADRLLLDDFILDPPPDCTHPDAHNVDDQYIENRAQHGTPLAPGLYCITGDVRIGSHDTFIGNGVTLYIVEGEHHRPAADFIIDGGAVINLTAPSTNPLDPDPSPARRGLLLYMNPVIPVPHPPAIVQITGNSSSIIQGTILAPTANVNMLGTGLLTAFNSQIIGWNVELGGANETYVYFDESQQTTEPTSLDLHR